MPSPRKTAIDWACRQHRTLAGRRCALCEDQLVLFDQTNGQVTERAATRPRRGKHE